MHINKVKKITGKLLALMLVLTMTAGSMDFEVLAAQSSEYGTQGSGEDDSTGGKTGTEENEEPDSDDPDDADPDKDHEDGSGSGTGKDAGDGEDPEEHGDGTEDADGDEDESEEITGEDTEEEEVPESAEDDAADEEETKDKDDAETEDLGSSEGFAGGNGTEDDPYLIRNADQLDLFAEDDGDNDRYYKITESFWYNDSLNLSDEDKRVFTRTNGGGYVHLDGNGKTIRNLCLDGTVEGGMAGLMGNGYYSTVSNLTLDGFEVYIGGGETDNDRDYSQVYVSPLGSGKSCTDCTISGDYVIEAEAQESPIYLYVSGLTSASQVSGCKYEAKMVVTDKALSGGLSDGNIKLAVAGIKCRNGGSSIITEKCENSGTIKIPWGTIAGIVYDAYGTCTKCKTTSSADLEITDVDEKNYTKSYLAGIAYYARGCSMSWCENNADLKGARYSAVSGIASIIGFSSVCENCDNHGDLSGGGVCGIAYVLNDGTISGCDNDGDLTSNIYKDEDGGYIGGSGFECASGIVDSIELSGSTWGESVKAIVKNCENSGNITGRSAAGIARETVLFDSDSTITISGCSNSGTVTSVECSNAAGILLDAFYYANIVNCWNEGSVTAPKGNAAGIIQSTGCAEIENCYNDGTVSGSCCGGIADRMAVHDEDIDDYPTISGCYNSGTVDAGKYDKAGDKAGGIAADVANGSISCCYNTGSVSGYQVGGIVGYAQNFYGDIDISDSYNAGTITAWSDNGAGGLIGRCSPYDDYYVNVTNCYSVGDFTPGHSYVDEYGQLFGDWYCGSGGANYYVSGLYYDSSDGGSIGYLLGDGSEGVADGCNGVSDDDLKSEATYEDWDFTNTWTMGQGDYKYPILLLSTGPGYKITYELNDDGRGAVNDSKNKKRFSEEDTITLYNPHWDGFSFEGWYLTEDFTGDRVTEISGAVAQDVTLYAKWIKGDEYLDTITINGSGYAYLRVTPYNDQGRVEDPEDVTWKLYEDTDEGWKKVGESGDSSDTENSDPDSGVVTIVTPKLTFEGENPKINKDYDFKIVLADAETGTEFVYSIYATVSVKSFSYKQTWDAQIDKTAKIGTDLLSYEGASFDISMAEASVSGSLGSHITVEQGADAGVKSLTVEESFPAKINGKVSVGPNVSFKGEDSESSLLMSKLGVGLAAGASSASEQYWGIQFDDYTSAEDELSEDYVDNDSGLDDEYRLGLFLVTCQAIQKGNAMLLYLVEAATMNTGLYNIAGVKNTIGVTGEATGADLTLLNGLGISDKYETNVSYGYSESERLDIPNSTVSRDFKIDSKRGVSVTGTLEDDDDDDDVKVTLDSTGFSIENADSCTVSGTRLGDRKKADDFSSVTYTLTSKDGDSSTYLMGSGSSESGSMSITYSGDSAQDACDEINAFNILKYGGYNSFMDAEDCSTLRRQIKNSDLTGSLKYTRSKDTALTFQIPFKVGPASFSTKFTGKYSKSSDSSTGTYTDGTSTINAVNDEDQIDSASMMTIFDILEDPMQKCCIDLYNAVNDVKETISGEAETVVSTVKGTVSGTLKTVKGAGKYALHIFAPGADSGTEALSYTVCDVTAYDEISALGDGSTLDDDIEEISTSDTVSTIGYPYMVYVTADGNDSMEDALDEFPEDASFEITLGYDLEDLQAAGIESIDGGNIGIYEYSEELEGYMYIGGERDASANTVTAEITEPGQYILAADDECPEVTAAEVSDSSLTPTVKIEFSDVTGFKDLSVKIDDTEIINESNYKDYYRASSKVMVYKPETSLEEGIHVLSVYAEDAAGNAMKAPFEYSFITDVTAPMAEDVSVVTDDNTIRIKVNSEADDIASITAAVVETGSLEDETAETSVELTAASDSGWYTGTCERKIDGSTVVVSELKLTDYSGNAGTYGPYGGDAVKITSDALSDLWYVLPDGQSFTYTGSAIKPAIKVYEGNRLLKEKTDYTVSYVRNTAVYEYAEGEDGFNETKAPCIVITGKGNYSEKDSIPFTIQKKDISDKDVSTAEISPVIYNSKTHKDQKPVPSVVWGKKKLSAGKDFTVKYYAEDTEGVNAGETAVTIDDDAASTIPNEPGTYYVKADGCGSYTGTVIRKFVIGVETQKTVSSLSIGKIKDRTYTGEKLILKLRTPDMDKSEAVDLTVKDGKNELCGTDAENYAGLDPSEQEKYAFTVSYDDDSITPGTHTLTVTGTGTGYIGSKTITYKIKADSTKTAKTDIKKAKLNGFVSAFTYDGTAKTQDGLSLVFGADKKSAGATLEGISTDEYRRLDETAKLKYQYTYEYSGNVNVGTAKLIITGINDYTGTVTKTFRINAYDITKADEEDFTILVLDKNVYYHKGGAKPEIGVWFGNTRLTEGTDYTVAYKNNTAVTEDRALQESRMPVAVITGKGNFKGTHKSPTFDIVYADIADAAVTAVDVVPSSKKNWWKSAVTVTDSDGKKLTAGTDYYKDITYEYWDEYDEDYWELYDGEDPAVGTKIKVTVWGKGNYEGGSGECFGYYRVVGGSIAKAAVTVDPSTKAYTGQAVTLDSDEITVNVGSKKAPEYLDISTDGGKTGDFMIVEDSYANNVNKGKASVVIRGINDYTGEKKITYNIGTKSFKWWFRNLLGE